MYRSDYDAKFARKSLDIIELEVRRPVPNIESDCLPWVTNVWLARLQQAQEGDFSFHRFEKIDLPHSAMNVLS